MPAPKDPKKRAEWIRNMSEARKGKNKGKKKPPRTAEHRRNLSKSLKGRPAWNKGLTISEEQRQKQSRAMSGRKLSDVHKGKISAGLRGRKVSEETRRKIGNSNKGKIRSKETLRKLSDAHKGKKLSTEQKRKIGEFHRGRKRSAETCRKISEGLLASTKPTGGKNIQHGHFYAFALPDGSIMIGIFKEGREGARARDYRNGDTKHRAPPAGWFQGFDFVSEAHDWPCHTSEQPVLQYFRDRGYIVDGEVVEGASLDEVIEAFEAQGTTLTDCPRVW